MTENNIIKLDPTNSIQILFQQIAISQKKGVFELEEANMLKRCKSILLESITDPDLGYSMARQIVVQAVKKSQKTGGVDDLETASLLFNVCQYVLANLNAPLTGTVLANTQAPTSVPADDSLDELSEPVPLVPMVL